MIRQASCGCRVCYNILVYRFFIYNYIQYNFTLQYRYDCYRSICSECSLPVVDIREASCGCIVCGRCYGTLSDMYVSYAMHAYNLTVQYIYLYDYYRSICSECGLPAMYIRQASCGCSVCGRCYNSRYIMPYNLTIQYSE